MSQHPRKPGAARAPALGFWKLSAAALGSLLGAGDRLVMRAGSQVRAAILHPLRPFPLAHVAGGGAGAAPSSQAISEQDTLMMREHHHPLGIAGLPSSTLQHAHALLTLLPMRLPMPQTRRHGHGQVALEWSGNGGRKLSVLIGQDGMMIYSARFGTRGRLDGAEPIGDTLSPVLAYAIDQLGD